jgi:hypothetical protein
MMMTRRRVSAAGVLLLCLGCGSSGGNNNNNPSLSVSPSTTTVIAGGTAVSFTATLSNATGTVSWTLTGPGSITPLTGTNTSYTPPAAVASATTATLTASGDRRADSPGRRLEHLLARNVAETDFAPGASRKLWPLQKGFDRFYGFLGGETNQWYPDLVEDNGYIEPPHGPEKGYHLSKDLADKAIEMLRNQKATNPSRPWFLWFNPGANHAPHHAPKDYIAKYKGKFDDGYEAYRTWVLARMIDRGHDPKSRGQRCLRAAVQDTLLQSGGIR